MKKNTESVSANDLIGKISTFKTNFIKKTRFNQKKNGFEQI